MRLAQRLLLSFVLCLAFPCCTHEAWHPPMARPLTSRTDTTWVPAGTTITKLKASTVILQAGTGNEATTVTNARAPVATGTGKAQDFTKAGQHGGALATEPNATAQAATTKGIPPWALVASGVIVFSILVLGLAYKFRTLLL